MKYILILVLLGGCAQHELLKGSGRPAEPPGGYTKLCREHPEVASCPQVKS